MKRLHVIHNKTIQDVGLQHKGTVLAALETEVLTWAKEHKPDAYALTLPIQTDYLKNPNSLETGNKYFKYLRRLFELKLQFVDDIATKAGGKFPEVNADLQLRLNVESLRMLDFISCSQIQMYEFCPRKFYWRYVKGIKFPKTHALHFGTSIDNTFNTYYEEKIKGNIMPRTAIYAQFYEEFEKGKEEVVWGDQDPKRFLKIGPKVIDAYLDKFDPITKAVDVQTECIVHLDNGGKLIGYIDILEEKEIVDTKTAAKPWETQGRFAKHLQEIQPRAYSLWYLETYETMPGFRYQIVTKPETENDAPQTQLIRVELKKFEVEAFRRHIQKIWDEIQAAIPKGKAGFPAIADEVPAKGLTPDQAKQASLFAKTNEGKKMLDKKPHPPLCCEKYCDYANTCRADGLKIPKEYVKKQGNTPAHFIW